MDRLCQNKSRVEAVQRNARASVTGASPTPSFARELLRPRRTHGRDTYRRPEAASPEGDHSRHVRPPAAFDPMAYVIRKMIGAARRSLSDRSRPGTPAETYRSPSTLGGAQGRGRNNPSQTVADRLDSPPLLRARARHRAATEGCRRACDRRPLTVDSITLPTHKTGRVGSGHITPMLREVLGATDLSAARRSSRRPTATREKSLTGRMADWTHAAGLPKGCTNHGLRKTLGKPSWRDAVDHRGRRWRRLVTTTEAGRALQRGVGPRDASARRHGQGDGLDRAPKGGRITGRITSTDNRQISPLKHLIFGAPKGTRTPVFAVRGRAHHNRDGRPRFLWTAICQRGDRGDEGHETRKIEGS